MRAPAIASVLLTALCATSCGNAPLCIEAPAKNEILTWMPVDFALSVRETADLDSFQVSLNGVDITDAFGVDPAVEGRIFIAAVGFWDPALLQVGRNQILVDVVVDGFARQKERTFYLEGDAYADAVLDFAPGVGAGFGRASNGLGGPVGGGAFLGSLDVVSLGIGGVIEVEFVDNVVVDGPGPDLIVFENSFLEVATGLLTSDPFSEPGRVLVSQDGDTWVPFPCALDPGSAPFFPGCAGIYPVFADEGDPVGPHGTEPSAAPVEELVGVYFFDFAPPEGAGGDAFDLADVGLDWIRFVRIEAADFAAGVQGPNNAGFDLDAVAAVNSRPLAVATFGGGALAPR